MGRLTRPHWHWIDPTHQTKEHTLTCDMAHMGSAHHHITTTLEHCPQLSKPSIHVFVVAGENAEVQPARRMQRRCGGRERRWSRGRRLGCIRSPAGRSASAARRPRRLLPALAAGRRSAWRMAVLFGAHLRALAPTRRRFGRGGSSPLVFLHSVGEALCRAKRGPWGRGQWGDGHRGGSDPMCGQGSRSGCVDSQQRE